MEKTILQSMNMRLSKVVIIKNAFTGEMVKSGIKIRTNMGKKPVVKPDGHCLFVNMTEDTFGIEIESPIFQDRRLTLTADGGQEVEEIFLYPSSAYPIKRGTTILTGKLEKNTIVKFYLDMEKDICKLLDDYKKGEDIITIFAKGQKNKACRYWFIKDKEKGKGEFFRLSRAIEEGAGQLETLMKDSYKKKNALLYAAYECPVDTNGNLFFIMNHLSAEEYKLCYSYEKDGKEVQKEMIIRGMEGNTLTL